jgi:hypothetical protein
MKPGIGSVALQMEREMGGLLGDHAAQPSATRLLSLRSVAFSAAC